MFQRLMTGLVCLIVAAPLLHSQDDVADVKSQERKAGNDEKKKYVLIGPAAGSRQPANGYGLIVVMPGGGGDAAFVPFVKRIFKNSIPAGYLVAQPIAVKWTPNQNIVWPTAKNNVNGMKFTTEEFVEAVISDVASSYKINPDKVLTLSWSSSGPAAYAISLTSKQVKGSFIAMSVFKPDQLPDLKQAKNHRYFLYHSPDDRVCPFRMAEQAVKDLEKNGAKISMITYQGGHGWKGNMYQSLREGFQWLEKNE